ncbi:hypothetical protein [Belnapia mucosa]|uniref:hypothetical protein n=1 Tax=Belnapia mucosa TaxID=2804532 RepID=UPI0038B2C8BF
MQARHVDSPSCCLAVRATLSRTRHGIVPGVQHHRPPLRRWTRRRVWLLPRNGIPI